MPAARYLEFVYLPSFERSKKDVLTDAEERWIEQALCDDPHEGATIANTGGVRKLRVALEGAGKSGGARVIYYFRGRAGRVYLILAYPKSRKETISDAEKKAMRQLTTRLEEES